MKEVSLLGTSSTESTLVFIYTMIFIYIVADNLVWDFATMPLLDNCCANLASIPGRVFAFITVSLTVIKAKTRPGIEASANRN